MTSRSEFPSLWDGLSTTLMDIYYADREQGAPGVDWRRILEGEEVLIEWDPEQPPQEAVRTLTFVSDGVRQVAPPRAFDARRCAWSVKQALEKKENGTW